MLVKGGNMHTYTFRLQEYKNYSKQALKGGYADYYHEVIKTSVSKLTDTV